MRWLVLLSILISVIAAYYDETLDYWYSNDDGVVIDNLVGRSNNNGYNNSKSIQEVNYGLFTQTPENLTKIGRQSEAKERSSKGSLRPVPRRRPPPSDEEPERLKKKLSKHKAKPLQRRHHVFMLYGFKKLTRKPDVGKPKLSRPKGDYKGSLKGRFAKKLKKWPPEMDYPQHNRLKMKLSNYKAKFVLKGEVETLTNSKSWWKNKKECSYGVFTNIGCNKCICMAPMVYVCSSKICTNRDEKPQCIDGAPVESRDCNTCICANGKILCTLMNCRLEKNKIRALTKLKNAITEEDGVQCIDGEPVTVDSCNTCSCLGGRVYCTIMNCNAGVSLLKLSSPINTNTCHKGTWYSPVGNPQCRPCYCLNDKVSFCYTGLCKIDDPGVTNSNDPQKCKPGQTLNKGSCKVCTCNQKGYWTCSNPNDKRSCDDNQIGNKEGSDFVLGTSSTCLECRFSMGVWECTCSHSQCTDYDTTQVEVNSFFSNTQGPCSTCYSDPNDGNVCATDIKCSQTYYANVKPIGKCSSHTTCKQSCSEANKAGGRCFMENCVCF